MNILISIPYSLFTPLLIESYGLSQMAFHKIFKVNCVDYIFLPASPKAKAGLGVQSLRPSVCPSQNLVITTPLKLLIQFS